VGAAASCIRLLGLDYEGREIVSGSELKDIL